MKIKLNKADPLGGDEIPDVLIDISNPLPDCMIKSLEDVKKQFDEQAELLEQALYSVLPQGTYDRLAIKLMSRKVSLYVGITR